MTTYFLPSTRVTTVSGVASMRSMRSALRANTEPERRVRVIMGRTVLVLGAEPPSVAARRPHRPRPRRPEEWFAGVEVVSPADRGNHRVGTAVPGPREVPVRMCIGRGRGPCVRGAGRSPPAPSVRSRRPSRRGPARGYGGRATRGRPGRRAPIRCSGGTATEPALWCDSREAADIAEPIEPAEANEPTLAIDANEAALPIERTESWEQIERSEFSDHSDHTPAA